jgi:DNA-binding NtrC family response regulator
VEDKANPVYVVLLADADPDVHRLVAAALPEGCAFLGARTKDLALRLARKRPPSLCIVCDDMPDTTPEALVSELQALSPPMRAMVLTSSRDGAQTARLRGIGTVHSKPLELDRLRDAITNALRFCKMFESVAHLKSESVNVKTWSDARRDTRS